MANAIFNENVWVSSLSNNFPNIMSRISQTLSLLSNLSSKSDAPPHENLKVATVTEQFLPRKQDAVFGDQFVFQTNLLRQRIDAKLLLLPPFPCDNPPYAKSVAYLSSRSGSIKARVYRHPGAENHFFRLHIFARERGVRVTLPPMFRGVVSVKDHDLVRRRKKVWYSRAFREYVRCGLIRLNTSASENDDEVCIDSEGKIELHLTTSEDASKRGWPRIDHRVRRIFKAA